MLDPNNREPEEGSTKVHYSRAEYVIDMQSLNYALDRYCDLTSFDLVLGIARGGLIPSLAFSSVLCAPHALISKTMETKFLYKTHVDLTKVKRVLLVDDILDTGITLVTTVNHLVALNSKIDIFIIVLHEVSSQNPVERMLRDNSNVGALLSASKLNRETKPWIVYPWEEDGELSEYQNFMLRLYSRN